MGSVALADRCGWRSRLTGVIRLSHGRCELVEGCLDGDVGGDFVVAAAQVLDERVPGGDDPRGPVAFRSCESESRTRSSLVKATFAIAATSIPWADSNTICARRQVTTEPVPRRTIRTSRRPSSSSISRTRRRSVTGPVWAIGTARKVPTGHVQTRQT
jgi:hypothetical protein